MPAATADSAAPPAPFACRCTGLRRCLSPLESAQPRLSPMSILVVQLAPRGRLRARSPGGAEPEADRAAAATTRYVLSPDGLAIASQGRCAASLLPRADSVALVLSDNDVSWHRITLPKAPAAKSARGAGRRAGRGAARRARERAPGAGAAGRRRPADLGRRGRPRLARCRAGRAGEGGRLRRPRAAAELARRPAERPLLARTDAAEGEVAGAALGACGRRGDAAPAGRPGAQPVAQAAAGGLALDAPRRPRRPPPSNGCSAPVAVLSPAERALQATRSLWNLRQFDLARRSRGTRALRDGAARPAQPGLAPAALRRRGAGADAGDRAQPVGLAPAIGARRAARRPGRAAADHVSAGARRPRRAAADAARDWLRCARRPASPTTATSSRCCRPPPPSGRPSSRPWSRSASNPAG